MAMNCLNKAWLQRITLRLAVLLLIVAIMITLSGCLQIDQVNQPQRARTGQLIEIKLTASTTAGNTDNFTPYGSIHLPTGWSVEGPVTYQGDYSGTLIQDYVLSADMDELYPREGYTWWLGTGAAHGPICNGMSAIGTWRVRIGTQPGFYTLDYAVGYNQLEPTDTQEHLPLTVTTDYGAIWDPATAPTAYVRAGQATLVNIPLTLINMGDAGQDRFNLSAAPPPGWNTQFIINGVQTTQTGSLSLFHRQAMTLRVTVPDSASPAVWTFPVMATSAAKPGVHVEAQVEVKVFGPEGLNPPQARGVELINM